MRIRIIRSPAVDAVEPSSLLPYITGRLRAEGFQDVQQRDLGPEALDHVLSGAYLKQCGEKVFSELAALEGAERLTASEQVRYAHLARTAVRAQSLVTLVDEAKAVLRTPERFYDLDAYRWALQTLQSALDLVSQSVYPGEDTVFDYRFRHNSFQTLAEVAADPGCIDHPFREFSDRAVREIAAERPDMVVIESAFKGQLLPALSLAYGLRQALGRDVTIALHGDYALAGIDLPGTPDLFRWIDLVAVSLYPNAGDGQPAAAALAAVARIVRDDGRLTSTRLAVVPNLVYWDREEARAIVTATASASVAGPLPVPAFDGLRHDLYLSPYPMANVALSRGCPWRRCAFCVRHDRYVPEDVATMVAQIAELSAQGFRCFHFVNDSNPPRLWRELALGLIAAETKVHWYGFARFEPEFTRELFDLLYRAGCRVIWFGFETISERLLKLMDKGTSPELIRRVIEDAHAAGIAVLLSGFVGFPSETREETMQTLDFLVEQRKRVVKASISLFMLQERSPVYQHPERYGVTSVSNELEETGDYRFETESGMTRAEVLDAFGELRAGLDRAYGGQLVEEIDRSVSFFYYTYSAHLAAHVDHHGVGALLREVTGNKPAETLPELLDPEARVMAEPWVTLTSLHYDLGALIDHTRAASNARASAIRGVTVEIREEPPMSRLAEPIWFLYNGRTHSLTRVSPAIALLVRRCGSEQRVADLLAGLSSGAARAVTQGISRLIRSKVLGLH